LPPFVGALDRFSAHLRKQVFRCRQCNPEGGDVIAFVQWHDGVTFAEAVMRLTGAEGRATCVVLEGPIISYASLWQRGHCTWQIRHDPNQGIDHLEAIGDLPPEFAVFRDTAMHQQRAREELRRPGELGVDYVFDVPLDAAATITGFRYMGPIEPDFYGGREPDDFFRNLRTLVPTNGNVLTRLSQPPKWWQTVGWIEYE
jgi:hypothetical protein